MVAPLIASALIGGATSLVGGAMNRKAQREANAANRPTEQVREWEEAGINPLFGISSGAFIPHQAASIGDSFATAGGRIARAFELQHEDQLRETELQKENTKLREQLDELATPRRPGYIQQYGDVLPLPSVGDENVSPEVSRKDVSVAGIRADGPQSDASRDLVITTPYGELHSDPNWTPYQEFEDEFGDLAGLVYSAVRGADLVADTLGRAYSVNIGAPFSEWMMSIGDNQGVHEPDVEPVWAGTTPRSVSPTFSEVEAYRSRRRALGY